MMIDIFPKENCGLLRMVLKLRFVTVTSKLEINHLIRFRTSELIENDSPFMILHQLVPVLSFAVYKKNVTVGGHLGFLGQGDIQTKN